MTALLLVWPEPVNQLAHALRARHVPGVYDNPISRPYVVLDHPLDDIETSLLGAQVMIKRGDREWLQLEGRETMTVRPSPVHVGEPTFGLTYIVQPQHSWLPF
jgi:hypothetical protein